MNPDSDQLTRFHLQQQPIRGALVQLQRSHLEALNGRDYPPSIRALLGQCLVATNLMAANLKQAASLTLQARGQGQLQLLMAECVRRDDVHEVRAVARFNSALTATSDSAPLTELLGKAQLAITIEPDGGQRYQGIVAVDQAQLGACLEQYFARSEQLPTKLQLFCTEDGAAGLLLQQMPAAGDSDPAALDDLWQELVTLAATLSADEIIQLPSDVILHRLFHQHHLALSPPRPVTFSCSCSRERTGRAVLYLDAREIDEILDQTGHIALDCEFCSTRYRFTRADIERLLAEQTGSRH